MGKYIDVDVFIKSFREALPGLKAQVDPDLTPKAYAYLRGGEAIIEDLTKFPTADVVEVRHGKWVHSEIEDDDWGRIFHEWTCSVCGYSVAHNPTGENYCPNCGAKMGGEGV